MSFSCTANAVTTQVGGGSVINPVTAGGDGKACQNAIAGNTTEAVALDDLIKAKTAYAAVDPGGAPPISSKPTAAAGIEGLEITLAQPDTLLGAGAARSSITASCAGGKPTFVPKSEVSSITIAGTPIVLDGVLQPITDQLTQAIGALVTVKLNEVVQLRNGGMAVRAAHVTLIPTNGGAAADVILAESRLDLNGAACDPNQRPTTARRRRRRRRRRCVRSAPSTTSHTTCA